MKLPIAIQIIVLILLSSCKSSPQMKDVKASIPDNSPENIELSGQEMQYNKIIKNFESNKFTETEVNEAFLIAKYYEANNKLDHAEKLLDFVYKYSPSVSTALNLAQLKILLKKTTEAKEIIKHARVLFPNNSDIFLMLIHIYQIENNLVQVSNLLNDGNKKYPKNESIAILSAFYNKKEAKKILENFIAKNPGSPNALLRLSTLFYQEKNYVESLKYAQKSHRYDIDNIDTIITIAKINEDLKNYVEAEKFYKNAFEKGMENNITAQHYINILLFQKKQQEALSVLLKLEASSDASAPFPPEFSFEIGRILIINQDYEGAKKRFESLLDEQFTNTLNQNEILFFLAYSCENLHLFDDAASYLEKINSDSAIYSAAQREKIFVAINSGKNDLAKELLTQFKIKADSYLEDVLFQASILMFFNQDNDALETLNNAIKDKPTEKELYLKRIEAYIHSRKNVDFIITEAEKIVKKWPKYADALNMLG
ncbi:MAG: hypothetical protein V4591_01460, partial [Bdellovibrionota bacterium]